MTSETWDGDQRRLSVYVEIAVTMHLEEAKKKVGNGAEEL